MKKYNVCIRTSKINKLRMLMYDAIISYAKTIED